VQWCTILLHRPHVDNIAPSSTFINKTLALCHYLRRLQLNATKTELIWFGSRQMLEKLADSDLTLDTGTTVICEVRS